MSREPELRWTVPDSWAWASLSQLGDIVAGGTSPSTKEPSYWSDEIHWISPKADLTGYSAKTIKRGVKSISRIGLANSSAKVMPAGSVHFSSRAPIGYVVISAESLATNCLRASRALSPRLASSTSMSITTCWRHESMRASARAARRSWSYLVKAFGKPSDTSCCHQNEQRRIVAKIEELFSELDKGVESLKTARGQLNVYRQAVLKHAFEGKLTAQWREENEDKLETPEQLLARIKQERETRYERQLKEWKAAVRTWEECGKARTETTKSQRHLSRSFFHVKVKSRIYLHCPTAGMWIKVQAGCSLSRVRQMPQSQ